MSEPVGLICLLIKSASAGMAAQHAADTSVQAANAAQDTLRKVLKINPEPPPGSMVGAGLTGGLLGAGLGAGLGGLYGYFTAPKDEVDWETGRRKSKWENVWPHMGLGAMGGGIIGGAAGMHGGFGEKIRALNWQKKVSPVLHAQYMRDVRPEHIPTKVWGFKGLHTENPL